MFIALWFSEVVHRRRKCRKGTHVTHSSDDRHIPSRYTSLCGDCRGLERLSRTTVSKRTETTQNNQDTYSASTCTGEKHKEYEQAFRSARLDSR